jgi:hypothetical protein
LALVPRRRGASLAAMHPRSWRWWHWLAASLAILALSLVTAAACLRSWSTARLGAVEARLRAEGRPTRYAEVLPLAPVRDAANHGAWLALESRWQALAGPALEPKLRQWLEAGAPAPTPPEVTAWLAAQAALIDDSAAALRRGGLALGAWPDQALFAGGRHPSLAETSAIHAGHVLVARTCALALAAAALDGGGEERLADLDRLVANLAPNCLLDAMMMRLVAGQRDQARLLALLRRPADAAARAWVASPPVVLTAGRVGMRGERLLFSAVFADTTLNEGPFSSRGGIYSWTLGPADAAVMVATVAGIESRLAGTAWTPAPIPRWAYISGIAIPNLDESSQTLIEGEAQERAARIAAELIIAWRGGAGPPADQAALPEALRARLAPTDPGSTTLRYLRNGEGFIVEVDPAAPRPPAMSRAPRPLGGKRPLVLGAGVAVDGPPAP